MEIIEKFRSAAASYGGYAFVAFVISAAGIYLYHHLPTFGADTTWLDFAGVFVPALLTAGLVFLYTRMSNIQNKQADLQERQTKVMDGELRPVLEVKDIGAMGDGITLELDNIGNGIARNLGIVVHVLCYNSDTDERVYFDHPNNRNQLRNLDGSISDLPPMREDPVELNTAVHVQSKVNQGLDRRLGPAISDYLEDSDIEFDQAYFQIEIVFDHLMSQPPGSKFLLPLRAPIDGQVTTEKLLENSNPVRGKFSTYTDSKEYGFQSPGDHFD